MDVFEAIAKRHSYRGRFTDAPVAREDLIKIVLAGIHAPSGKNEQTTSFVVVDRPELLRQIAEIVDKPACNISADYYSPTLRRLLGPPAPGNAAVTAASPQMST